MKVLYKEVAIIDGVEFLLYERDLSDFINESIEDGRLSSDHGEICNLVTAFITNNY